MWWHLFAQRGKSMKTALSGSKAACEVSINPAFKMLAII
jgi:hypothetical protein